MSAQGRGGRGRRGGRGAAPRSTNANGDQPSNRSDSQRGRGNASSSNGMARDIVKSLQRGGTNSRQAPRGPRTSMPSTRPNGTASTAGMGKPRVTGTLSERYTQIKLNREKERAEAMRRGYIVDPDRPRALADAVTPIGTCPDMCPEYERVIRMYENDVWAAEKASFDSKGEPIEARMVKKFRRSAAGLDEQLPSDLRPPQVLMRTVKYLFEELISEARSLSGIHNFIWDRTRAIRNDFSIQQLTKTPDVRIAIECLERIARFHILSLHQVGGVAKSGETYNWQQDREQLDRTLLSLNHYYDAVRQRYRSPNEAEFRAYGIVFQIQNPIADLEDRVQTWAKEVYNDARVQIALKLYAAASELTSPKGPLQPAVPLPIAQQNWDRFWKLVGSKQVPYIMACVAEIQFNHIRRGVLNAIWHATRQGAAKSTEDWTLEELGEALYFEDEEDTRSFAENFGFIIGQRADGEPFLDLNSVQGRDLPSLTPGIMSQTFSHDPVEKKRFNRSFSAIISGMTVKEAKTAGMVVEEIEKAQPSRKEKVESLFVTGDSDGEEGDDLSVKAPDAAKPNPFAAAFTPTGSFGFGSTTGGTSGFGGFGQPSFTTSQPASKPLSALANPFAATPEPDDKPKFPFGFPSQTTTTTSASPFSRHTTSAPGSSSPWGFTAAPLGTSNPSGFGQATSTESFPQRTQVSTPQSPFGQWEGATTPTATSQDASKLSLFHQATPSTTLEQTSRQLPSLFQFGAPLTATTTASEKPTIPTAASSQPAVQPTSSFGKLPGAFANPFLPPTSAQAEPSKPAIVSPLPKLEFTPQEEKSQVPRTFASLPASNPSLFQFPSSTTSAVSVPAPTPQQSVLSSGASPAPSTPFSFPKAPTFSPKPNDSTTAPFSIHSHKTPTFSPRPDDSTSAGPKPPRCPAGFQKATVGPIPESSSTLSSTKPSFSTLTPAPASNPPAASGTNLSFTASPLPALSSSRVASSAQSVATPFTPPNEEFRKDQALDFVARQLLLDPGVGFLKQYIEHISGPMITKARADHQAELDREEADEFRRLALGNRYFRLWRIKTKEKRMRRQMVEKRARLRAEKEAHLRRVKEREEREYSASQAIATEFETFRANLQTQQEASRPGLDFEYGLTGQTQQITQDASQQPSKTDSPIANKLEFNTRVTLQPRASVRTHQRSRTQPTISTASVPKNTSYRISKSGKVPTSSHSVLSLSDRGSLLKAAAYTGHDLLELTGAPLGTKMSTMKSRYFALKAAGIQASVYGTLLGSQFGRKRARDDGDEPPTIAGSPPERRRKTSSPSKPSCSSPIQNGAAVDRVGRISQSPFDGSETSEARRRHPEDEALFAKAQKVMKDMDEASTFIRDELRRSQTSASPSAASPPNASFLSASTLGASTVNLPKFYSRPSRFLPREEYGKRREPKKIEGQQAAKANGVTNGTPGPRTSANSTPLQQSRRPRQQAARSTNPQSKSTSSKSGASVDDAIEL